MGLFDHLRRQWRDPDPAVRLQAAQKAQHQKLLARMAALDTSPDVRRVSLSRISRPRFLRFVAERGISTEDRAAALAKLDPATTGTLLTALAASDAPPPLRQQALERLIHVKGILHVLRTSRHADQRLAALAKLPLQTNPKVFHNVCKTDPDVRVCLEAVARLNDDVILGKLAISHPVGKVRAAALSKTNNLAAIIRACTSDPMEENRLLSAGRITDQATLLNRALNDSSIPVAICAAGRLREPSHLLTVSTASTKPEIREAAIHQTAALASDLLRIADRDRHELLGLTAPRLSTSVIAACFLLAARKCDLLRRMVSEFFELHWVQLGPQLMPFLSRHFISTLIEKDLVPSQDSIRNLFYYLTPREPRFTAEALAFDRALSLQPLINARRANFFQEIVAIQQEVEAEIQMRQAGAFFAQGQDYRLDLLLGNLSTKQAEMQALTNQNQALNERVESAKNDLNAWVNAFGPDLMHLQAQLREIEERMPDLPPTWHSDDTLFFHCLRQRLLNPKLLYERSAFSDLVTTAFRDTVIANLARAALVSDQARFIREAFKDRIQLLPDSESRYKVDGPSCIHLANAIDGIPVVFLVAGPTVEQIELGPPGSDFEATTIEITPGTYTITCSPKGRDLDPLIVEGTCHPGRVYPIGVSLRQSTPDEQTASHALGDGQALDYAIFSVAEVDPSQPLSMTFDGGQYCIGKYLGSGSAGFVYAGTDAATGEVFAFKFMTALGLGARTQIDIGKKEWESYNRLQTKDRIVTIHAFSEQVRFLQGNRPLHGKRAVAAHKMEYARLGSLESYVATRQEALTLEFVIATMSDLCLGLQSLHESGFMHRDIRPPNILVLSEKPQCSICDFTLLSDKAATIKADLSAVFAAPQVAHSQDFLYRMNTGSTLQSFQRLVRSSTYFAAPEEHDNRGLPDCRSDIYAAGGVLYWLMVGFAPFELALRERNRSLYERHKAASDRKVVLLDDERRRKLFGELAELDRKMRGESLALKTTVSLDLHYEELAVRVVDRQCFERIRQILSKSICSDPARRYSTIREMLDDIQSTVPH